MGLCLSRRQLYDFVMTSSTAQRLASATSFDWTAFAFTGFGLLVLFAALFVAVWLLVRRLRLWYWRLDEIADTLNAILDELKKR
jgi:hypothetical protein